VNSYLNFVSLKVINIDLIMVAIVYSSTKMLTTEVEKTSVKLRRRNLTTISWWQNINVWTLVRPSVYFPLSSQRDLYLSSWLF